MTQQKSPLALAAQRLTEAVEQETRVARAGALVDLASAAWAKQIAFAAFNELQDSAVVSETLEQSDRDAIHGLLIAANENSLVLEAVKSTLDDVAARLHAILGSVADPGTYSRIGRSARHVPATRFDARA
jgi:hypothetical protein